MWEVTIPAGFGPFGHIHALPQIFILCEGVVQEIVGRTVRTFRRGATLLRPPGVDRFQVSERPVRSVVVDVADPRCRRYMERFPSGMVSPEASSLVVRDIPSRILDELAIGDDISKVALQGLLLSLVAVLGRVSMKRPLRAPAWLTQAVQLVESCYRQPLSLHDIAGAVKRHPSLVAREFRRIVGVSIGDHIRDLRFRFAAHQVLSTGASLTEIADSAGYCDQAHLTREFHKRSGMSPAEFRRIRGR